METQLSLLTLAVLEQNIFYIKPMVYKYLVKLYLEVENENSPSFFSTHCAVLPKVQGIFIISLSLSY